MNIYETTYVFAPSGGRGLKTAPPPVPCFIRVPPCAAGPHCSGTFRSGNRLFPQILG